MKKFLIKMVLSVLFLFLFSLRFLDVTVGENMVEHPLERAWEATGLKLESVSSEAWFRLNDRWLTIPELKQLSKQLCQRLNLELHSGLTMGEGPDFTYLSFEGLQPDRTVVTVTLQSSKGPTLQETQLGLYTVSPRNIKNLRRYIENLKNTVEQLAKETNLSVLLEGSCPGKLAPALVKELTSKAFRKLHAKLVEATIRSDGSISKGYAPCLRDSVHSISQQSNLVISTIYDPGRNLTEVIMATPALNGGV